MMKDLIIRAWKDPEFRAQLSAEERAAVPECPAGKPLTDLDEGSLSAVVGGFIGPDQDLSDFNPRITPYIRVSTPVRLDQVAAIQHVAVLRY
ncbi:mersacidin/lichenicidin family type 2 lantibiotic [Hyalangium minutum]|uniref:Mersacidin/lichenicidin family type 2 lantibiotic n=1 Tax=Hyalangium minutum TaxID=394096 RepID=A0A085WKI0_9BACT|nr:mersacidin/lichenicidin family type 2 lantibiotic [Hyalangium minutum]KFE68193.1 hypothetical protein DB31_7430 [Hyalangium minutum]